MTRCAVKGLWVGGFAILLVGVMLSLKTKSVRYRMYISIDTPLGVRTGEADREVSFTQTPNLPILGEDRPLWRVRGKAISIPFPNGRTLYALLKGGKGEDDYSALLPSRTFLSESRSKAVSVTNLWPPSSQNIEFQRARVDPLPLLITFKNPKDVKSLVVVQPSELSFYFGDGVKIKGILVKKLSGLRRAVDINMLPKLGKGSGFAEWQRTLAYSDIRRNITMDDFNRDDTR